MQICTNQFLALQHTSAKLIQMSCYFQQRIGHPSHLPIPTNLQSKSIKIISSYAINMKENQHGRSQLLIKENYWKYTALHSRARAAYLMCVISLITKLTPTVVQTIYYIWISSIKVVMYRTPYRTTGKYYIFRLLAKTSFTIMRAARPPEL